MTKIFVDATLAAKLHQVQESVQLTDETGRILGRFVPFAEDARQQPQISDEEINRRLNQGGGRPLADILADLEKRG